MNRGAKAWPAKGPTGAGLGPGNDHRTPESERSSLSARLLADISYLRSLMHVRRRVEQALMAVAQEANMRGGKYPARR